MSKRGKIESQLYAAEELFQLHQFPEFDDQNMPLASKGNLDLAKVFTNSRQKNNGLQNKGKNFWENFQNNSGAAKLTTPKLDNPILSDNGLSQRIAGDPTRYQKLGHTERRLMMDLLSKFIPEKEFTNPFYDYSSDDLKERELERYNNLWKKREVYKSLLNEQKANVGLWTERTPCDYGLNGQHCQNFVNEILPLGSNVGHILPPKKYEKIADQAVRLSTLYQKLQKSHEDYNNSISSSTNKTRFDLPFVQNVQISQASLPKPVSLATVKTKDVVEVYSEKRTRRNSSTPESNTYELGDTPSPEDSHLWGISTGSDYSDYSDYSDEELINSRLPFYVPGVSGFFFSLRENTPSPMGNTINLLNTPVVNNFSNEHTFKANTGSKTEGDRKIKPIPL